MTIGCDAAHIDSADYDELAKMRKGKRNISDNSIHPVFSH